MLCSRARDQVVLCMGDSKSMGIQETLRKAKPYSDKSSNKGIISDEVNERDTDLTAGTTTIARFFCEQHTSADSMEKADIRVSQCE